MVIIIKKKCIIIALIFIMSSALIFIVLLTPVISVPSLIYLKDTEDKYAKIYNVKQVDKLSLLTSGNNDYFLSNLKYCDNLRELTIDLNIYPNIDISSLSSLNINNLILVNYKYGDIFNGFENLNNLTLLYPDTCDCKMFVDLSNLKELYLDTDEIANIDALSKLDSLEELSVYVPILKFKSIDNLKVLNINSNEIENIDDIIEMSDLEVISISNVQTVGISLELFTKLPNLKSLKLSNCNIVDSAKMTKEFTDMLKNKLEEFDIS